MKRVVLLFSLCFLFGAAYGQDIHQQAIDDIFVDYRSLHNNLTLSNMAYHSKFLELDLRESYYNEHYRSYFAVCIANVIFPGLGTVFAGYPVIGWINFGTLVSGLLLVFINVDQQSYTDEKIAGAIVLTSYGFSLASGPFFAWRWNKRLKVGLRLEEPEEDSVSFYDNSDLRIGLQFRTDF